MSCFVTEAQILAMTGTTCLGSGASPPRGCHCDEVDQLGVNHPMLIFSILSHQWLQFWYISSALQLKTRNLLERNSLRLISLSAFLGGDFQLVSGADKPFSNLLKRSNFTSHKFLDIDTLDHLECVSLVLATPWEQYKVYKLYWSKDNSNL